MEPIKCPSCDSTRFEVHEIVNLMIDGVGIKQINERKPYTCVKCNFAIENIGDLNMTTIDVYLVGNSMSGMRQGLRKVLKVIDVSLKQGDYDLASQGFHETGGLEGPEEPWIFTKLQWEKVSTGTDFRLMEGQYTVNLVDMTS
jgi:hypothetical protein